MSKENSELINNKKIAINQKLGSYAMVIALAAIWILFTVLTKGTFISIRNLSNLFRFTGIKGILVIGMFGCLVSGVFDLSLGSVVGLTGAIIGILLEKMGMPLVPAIIITLICGILIGLFQGYWIAYRGVPAIIVTLAGMLVFRGLTIILTNGCSIPISNPAFALIGQEYLPNWLSVVLGILLFAGIILSDSVKRRQRIEYNFGVSSKNKTIFKYIIIFAIIFLFVLGFNSYHGIPIPVLLLIVFYLIFAFVYNKTQYGRYVYAIGGNLNAAKLSGINIKRIYLKVFVLISSLATIAGIILTSRLATATTDAGTSFEMDAIASCVIGGVNLAGGRGGLFGALIGALVMTSLGNGMSLMNMEAAWQNVVKGLILLLAVWFDVTRNKQNN